MLTLPVDQKDEYGIPYCLFALERLSPIRMFAESLLRGKPKKTEVQAEYLETIVGESEGLSRLLNNVLDFSKIEKGIRTYAREPVSLEEGYEVHVALDAESGHRLAREKQPHLIVLDIMLPGMDGYELCRKLRKESLSTPLLMLTVRGEEADRVRGLDLEADDYVAKTFSLQELLARIRALLRRAAENIGGPVPHILQIRDVTVDFRKYEARKGTRILEMSCKEFGILRCLASRQGEVFSRTELLDEVWGQDS